ncbi:MAG: ribulose-phosphate 3-epimerase [Clostridiales bacterium]|nr:ribulose-phosphate 3-epimerase [Clostridiales bacterium]
MVTFSPSLMCMNLGKMKEQFTIMDNYIDLYHVDIMDGHFCKNMALTPGLIKSFRENTKKDMDVHLMTTNPSDWIEMCAKSGATYISPHAETINTDAFRTMQLIQSLGCKCGVVLNPATPLSYVESYLEYIDILTIMTVDIGFAGQKFIDQMYEKIIQAKEIREAKGYHYKIQIDGHCNKENYRQLVEAGADVLVVGNAGLFGLDQDLDIACKKMNMEFEQCMLNEKV